MPTSKRLTPLPLLTLFLTSAALAQTPNDQPPAVVAAPEPVPVAPPAEPAKTVSIPLELKLTASPHPKLEFNKWSLELYGFAEFDAIHDDTQGLGETAGNSLIARPGASGATHAQTQFSIRNSRLGLKLGSPAWHGVKANGLFEMDFFGNQPAIQQTGSVNGGNAIAGGVSEAAFFNNPGFRVRHMALILETPFVNVLAGQYWELFGWQSAFHPNTVEIQGVPGQVYSRTAQLRVSHAFTSKYVTFEAAVAMLRPPERASEAPDGQAGLKISFPMLKGVRTGGSTGTSVDSAAIGVSGVMRKFSVANPLGSGSWASANGQGVSVDAFIPVIPATNDDRGNGLSITGSYVNGAGIADLYTGLNGGFGLQQTSETGGLPSCPQPVDPTTGKAPKCYSAPLDGGLVAFDKNGTLTAIKWQTFMVGVQYYLPGGFIWVSGNYAQADSSNSQSLAGSGNAKTTANKIRWANANVMWDVTPWARLGFEYARYMTTYNDGVDANSNRLQLSAFYIF